MTTQPLPKTQYAVQLVGPSSLKLNPAKAVTPPGPYEILIRIDACGLCFSDLKLLKQFSAHPRKSDVQAGLTKAVLGEIQGYVPGDMPTVPGHEVVGRVVAVGAAVQHHKVGERVLVQADWRDLKTGGSNGAFGYNFEGGLQEYCLLDERVVIDSKGQRYLLQAQEEKSASQVALVEPWACVEDSYVARERRTIKAGGRLLLVAATKLAESHYPALPYDPAGRPAEIVSSAASEAAALPDERFDDIVYLGADKATIDLLNDKLATRGIINIVLGGKKIGAPVSVGVGRVHYGMTRWVGTTGSDAAAGYKHIPATGELRPKDKVVVIGAGGPMGQMHVIRNVCSGLHGVEIVATDMDDARLASLGHKASPLAKANGVTLRLVNTAKTKLNELFTYHAIMAPIGALVAAAVKTSAQGAIINIFAGIPAGVKQEIDLDAYIENRVFMFGTSGSEIEDMLIVLRKVESGQLNTNTSVDAIAGMAGAIDGIAATENRTLAGKIIVYPMLHDVGLIPLVDLAKHYPTVAAKLENGQWTKAAEQELLHVAGKQ
jgi:threonine dehydrogenase-like Zn-dependent dehydrogenase